MTELDPKGLEAACRVLALRSAKNIHFGNEASANFLIDGVSEGIEPAVKAAITAYLSAQESVPVSDEIEALRKERDDLKKILEFYADRKTYQANGHPQIDADTKPILSDGGFRARIMVGDPS